MPGTPLQTRLASQDVANNEDFFRLFQEVTSSGDIFEVDASMRAWCVGPQSDLSSFNIYYYDQQLAPNRQNVLEVSVGNPFPATIFSLLDRQYPGVNNPAQMLVATRDLVNPDYLPRDFNAVGPPPDVVMRFPPRIDLIGMLEKPTGSAPIRSDRVYNLNNVTSGVAESLWIIIPYYGRRQGTISITNLDVGGGIDAVIEVLGVRLGIGNTTTGTPQQRNTEIALTATPLTVVPQSDRQIVTKASEDGQFDLLVVRVQDLGILADRLLMDIITSDRES